MSVSVYDSTVSMLKNIPDDDLLIVKEFINTLSSKQKVRSEMYNPYKPLTREEIIEQLAIAKSHADEGKVLAAREASGSIRKKYGL